MKLFCGLLFFYALTAAAEEPPQPGRLYNVPPTFGVPDTIYPVARPDDVIDTTKVDTLDFLTLPTGKRVLFPGLHAARVKALQKKLHLIKLIRTGTSTQTPTPNNPQEEK